MALLVPLIGAGCDVEGSSGDTAPAAEPGEQVLQEEAFPGQTGEERRGIFDTPHGQQELIYQLIDGERVFQGDILLPPEIPAAERRRSAGVSGRGARWPNALVRVETTSDSGDLSNDPRVLAAMQHWMERTHVRFGYGATSGNRVRFVTAPSATTCSSAVGVAGGVQNVNIGSSCTTGNVIHELGHAMGLFHEQSRTDRNSFVTVFPNCIQSGQAGNFAVFGSEGLNVATYETNSIMHYGSRAFLDTSVPGCTATITRTDGTTFNPNRTAVTGGDIAGIQALYMAWWLRLPAVDWDQDGRADIAVWRPSNATWFVLNSGGGRNDRRHGAQTDVPVPGDYDGDVRGDLAVWRPTTGQWFVIQSRNNTSVTHQWGVLGDIPVPGDYTGDGVIDRAVWRPSEGNWYVLTDNSVTTWGEPGDVPVPGDYDFDFVTDFAIWRPSTGDWWVLESSTGNVSRIQWGAPVDIPVPADYDGDGFTDRAVWRPGDGNWYIMSGRTGSTSATEWGIYADVPAPADYDGDGSADLAVWRPNEGNWYIVSSSTGGTSVTQFGQAGDTPIP